MSSRETSEAVSSSLQGLRLDSQSSKKSKNKSQNKVVVDSWDDDMSDGEESNPTTPTYAHSRDNSLQADFPSAPPPTPASPHVHDFSRYGGGLATEPLSGNTGQGRGSPSLDSRPEKTAAVASRMIAGALGVKPAKRTDEQRAYDKAVKDNEAKRRNMERDAQRREEEARERAKKDIWDG